MVDERYARSVVVTLSFRKEGQDTWTGECLELGTATFGRTFEETRDELVELIELHVNALEGVAERERFFDEHKVSAVGDVSASAPTTLCLEEKLLLPAQ